MDVGNKTTVSFVKAGTSSKEAVLRALRETKSNVQLYVFEKPRYR